MSTKQDNLTIEAALRLEAKRLMEQTRLIKSLSRIGRVEIGGSFSYRLMVDRDIDIHVLTLPDEDSLLLRAKACQELLQSISNIQKLKLVDFVNHPRDSTKPRGIWVGLTIDFNGHVWNIDVWLIESEVDLGMQDGHLTIREVDELTLLSDHERADILLMKQKNNDSDHRIPSVEIYRTYLNRRRTTGDLRASAA